VDVGLLDKLMNLVGELVLTRNQVLQFNSRQNDTAFGGISQRLNLITTELQEGVMKTRMQPIGVVWKTLPRLVRDLSAACGKRIQLAMEGEDTELDKTIIEAIKDPLTHLVRNCCDHGIEEPAGRVSSGKSAQGVISLRAYHEGGQVNIEISDDGAGIDADRVREKAIQKGLLRPEQARQLSEKDALGLIFLPGLSTAPKVTSVSGRGVGMDVVKTNIEKIGGSIDIASRRGLGTTIKLRIPLTLAIIPGLLVLCGDERFIIPQVSLLELIRLEPEAAARLVQPIHGVRVYRRRGALLPLVYLNEVLELDPSGGDDAVSVVVLQAENQQFGLVVDSICDTQEIVVKPLGKELKGLSCYAGSTILGDGSVALILDVSGLAERACVLSPERDDVKSAADSSGAAEDLSQLLLLFRAGRFSRLAVPLSLVARLEEFQQSQIEQAGGRPVVQYRGDILRLCSLSGILEQSGCDSLPVSPLIQAIVFRDRDRQIGVVVDEVLDIVEARVAAQKSSQHPGLLGSAVVDGQIADMVDLHAVIQSADESWFGSSCGRAEGSSVLIAEGSGFSRALLRGRLEMAGHRVIEAGSASDALEILVREKVDAVATALDLPGGGGSALLAGMRGQPDLQGIPTIAMAASSAELSGGNEFDRYEMKFAYAEMVRDLEELMAHVQAADEAGANSEVVVRI
jgi:two-component system chemotaxis sensor kinase CheA